MTVVFHRVVIVTKDDDCSHFFFALSLAAFTFTSRTNVAAKSPTTKRYLPAHVISVKNDRPAAVTLHSEREKRQT